MMLWLIFIVFIGATVGILLQPLLRSRPAPNERRLYRIAIILIAVLLPIGAMFLYNYLGMPDVPGHPLHHK